MHGRSDLAVVGTLRHGQCADRASFGGKGILEAGERRVDGPSRKGKQIRSRMSLSD